MIAGDAKTRSFALKQMKKSQIVETRQQQHIMSGWTLMLMILLMLVIKMMLMIMLIMLMMTLLLMMKI